MLKKLFPQSTKRESKKLVSIDLSAPYKTAVKTVKFTLILNLFQFLVILGLIVVNVFFPREIPVYKYGLLASGGEFQMLDVGDALRDNQYKPIMLSNAIRTYIQYRFGKTNVADTDIERLTTAGYMSTETIQENINNQLTSSTHSPKDKWPMERSIEFISDNPSPINPHIHFATVNKVDRYPNGDVFKQRYEVTIQYELGRTDIDKVYAVAFNPMGLKVSQINIAEVSARVKCDSIESQKCSPVNKLPAKTK